MATYTLDPAIVGSYQVFIFVSSDTKSATKMESVMVFQNIDTAATLKFQATDFDNTFQPATGVSLNLSSLSLFVNSSTGTLVPTVNPSYASNRIIGWTSSKTSVATVAQTGIVTPVGVGDAVITATTSDGGFTATANVNVSVKHLTAVAVTPVNLSMVQQGATGTLTPVFTPTDASYLTGTWVSSNTAVATVSSSGVVTPLTAGTTNITLTTTDRALTATAPVLLSSPMGSSMAG
jgi:hypothetical protein